MSRSLISFTLPYCFSITLSSAKVKKKKKTYTHQRIFLSYKISESLKTNMNSIMTKAKISMEVPTGTKSLIENLAK